MKICSKCKVEKSFDDFGKSKKSHDGRQHYCKDCMRAYKKGWVSENGELYLEKEKVKRREDRKDLAYVKRQKDYKYEYHRRPEVREHQRMKTRSYYENMSEEQKSRYARVTKIGFHHRRSLKAGIFSDLTVEDWLECMKFFDYECAYCGNEEKLSIDHIVPGSEGGKNTKRNIVPACMLCNTSKFTKEITEWYMGTDFYSIARLEKIKFWMAH